MRGEFCLRSILTVEQVLTKHLHITQYTLYRLKQLCHDFGIPFCKKKPEEGKMQGNEIYLDFTTYEP